MSRTFAVFKRKTFLLVRKRMSGAAAVDGQRRFFCSQNDMNLRESAKYTITRTVTCEVFPY